MTPPVAFDEDTWAEDMRRASPGAREIAAEARRTYEADGVPVRELRRSETEGRDGNSLEHCVKVYVPAPIGPHGMVLSNRP
jgi:hypothetical protein